jgi:hypothetical protein
MTPLGWGWALFVWGYAVAWFLATDPVILLAYRVLDPIKTDPMRTGAGRVARLGDQAAAIYQLKPVEASAARIAGHFDGDRTSVV